MMYGSNEPVYHVEVPSRKGVLDRPNSELLGSDEQLRIVKYYSSTIQTPKGKNQVVTDLFETFRIGFINQSLVMGFHDEKHKLLFDIDFEICWFRYLQTLKPGELSQEACSYKSQLKRHSDELFYRAVGTDRSKTNERTAQATTIFQNVSTNMGGGLNTGKGGGMLSKLASLFR